MPESCKLAFEKEPDGRIVWKIPPDCISKIGERLSREEASLEYFEGMVRLGMGLVERLSAQASTKSREDLDKALDEVMSQKLSYFLMSRDSRDELYKMISEFFLEKLDSLEYRIHLREETLEM